MKTLILIPCLLLFSACSGEDSGTTSNDKEQETSTAFASDAVTAETAEPDKSLPWGFTLITGGRYIHQINAFSQPNESSGGTATTLIAFEGTPEDIVDYYKAAAEKNGFNVKASLSSGALNAEKPSGEKLSVYAMKGGRKAKEGESSATLVFQKPK